MDATQGQECWRPVVGYEGFYEVSDLGRVRSVDRTVESIHGRTGTAYVSHRRGRVLKPGITTSGHRYVVLRSRITRTVHSLVAEAFIGPRPPGMEVRHENGHPSDCCVTNLKYGTRSQNAEDSKRHGTHFHSGLTHCKRGHELSGANLQRTAKGDRRTCLACRRERAALYSAGLQVTIEGYCINGHPKSPENRYTNGAGSTRCKPCANKQQKKLRRAA